VAVALVPLGTAFTFPCVTGLLSRVVPQHERGLYMGVQQTFGGAAKRDDAGDHRRHRVSLSPLWAVRLPVKLSRS
jgi:hypothetical protein